MNKLDNKFEEILEIIKKNLIILLTPIILLSAIGVYLNYKQITSLDLTRYNNKWTNLYLDKDLIEEINFEIELLLSSRNSEIDKYINLITFSSSISDDNSNKKNRNFTSNTSPKDFYILDDKEKRKEFLSGLLKKIIDRSIRSRFATEIRDNDYLYIQYQNPIDENDELGQNLINKKDLFLKNYENKIYSKISNIFNLENFRLENFLNASLSIKYKNLETLNNVIEKSPNNNQTISDIMIEAEILTFELEADQSIIDTQKIIVEELNNKYLSTIKNLLFKEIKNIIYTETTTKEAKNNYSNIYLFLFAKILIYTILGFILSSLIILFLLFKKNK